MLLVETCLVSKIYGSMIFQQKQSIIDAMLYDTAAEERRINLLQWPSQRVLFLPVPGLTAHQLNLVTLQPCSG